MILAENGVAGEVRKQVRAGKHLMEVDMVITFEKELEIRTTGRD